MNQGFWACVGLFFLVLFASWITFAVYLCYTVSVEASGQLERGEIFGNKKCDLPSKKPLLIYVPREDKKVDTGEIKY